MIVCLCEGINDTSLRAAIRSGCRSVSELARRTRAATRCGACACDLKALLEEARARDEMLDEPEALAAK